VFSSAQLYRHHWTDYKSSLAVSHLVSQSVSHNKLNALQVAIVHRFAPNLPLVTYCFWWKSEIFLFAKPEVELIFSIVYMKNWFNAKFIEHGKRCNVETIFMFKKLHYFHYLHVLLFFFTRT